MVLQRFSQSYDLVILRVKLQTQISQFLLLSFELRILLLELLDQDLVLIEEVVLFCKGPR